MEDGSRFRLERVGAKIRAQQASLPMTDHGQHSGHGKALVRGGIAGEVCVRELKKSGGRAETFLAQMDKRAGELDQPLVEKPIWAVAVSQPQLFEDVVRLEEFAPVETVEVTRVIRAQPASTLDADPLPDAFLLAQAPIPSSKEPAASGKHRLSRTWAMPSALV